MKSLGATRRRNGFGSSLSRPVVINTNISLVVIICLLLAYFVAQYRLMEQAYINVTPPIREDKHNNEPASRLRSSSATNDNHRIGAEPAPYISGTPPIREDKHSNETTSLLRLSNATNDNSHRIGAEPAPKKNDTYDPRRILLQPPRTDEHKVGYNPGNYTSDTHRDEWTYNLENYTSNSFLHTVDNYFELTQQNRSFFPIVPELPPLEVMRAYIQEHSQQHLENVWRECGNQSSCETLNSTQFIVGRYSCPMEAGNRLVRFMNGLLWAIATGRTFLWGHFDKEACLHMLADGDAFAEMCEMHLNSRQDCANILHLADWVPSWDEWSVKLNLTYPVRACAGASPRLDPIAIPMDDPAVPRVVHVGHQVNIDTGILLATWRPRVLREVLEEKQSRMRAKELFSIGVYFTYGMLFESLFTLDPSLFSSYPALDNNRVDTYMLHSRHKRKDDDGSTIGLEISCMTEVLSNRIDSDSKPCVVYAMTDRTKTREQLPEALSKFNCTAFFSDTTQSESWSSEHGPFAGRGFFEDLALVHQARRGFMSPNRKTRKGIRTSSALPRSIMEFRRMLESPSFKEIPVIKECIHG
jgi:hypothetical protein